MDYRKAPMFYRGYETVWLWMTFLILPISIFLFFSQNSGPSNSFNCLGHFKHVYDGDDDDDIAVKK